VCGQTQERLAGQLRPKPADSRPDMVRLSAAAAPLVPFVSIVIGATLPSRPVSAYELQTAPSGAPVRWFEDQVQFEIDLDDHLADLAHGSAAAAAERALETWSAAGGPLLVGMADEDDGDDRRDDGDEDGDEDRGDDESGGGDDGDGGERGRGRDDE